MRLVYRNRREVLLGALGRYAPGLSTSGASAGLHLVAWLPSGIDEAALIREAANLGVRVAGTTPYHLGSVTPRAGLLFGYGTLGAGDIEAGVRLVARALAKATADAE
jgi:GntR family transcriptional regulator/MocR family aminotransferase